MKSRLLYFLFLIGISNLCRAQHPDKLFIIHADGKSGYMDKDGKEVIPPQFLSAGEFSNGLAAVRLKGSYGYINEQGQFVIPAQYDYATAFSDGLALVYLDGQLLFIDSTGKKAFEAPYVKATPFKYGRAKVKTDSRMFGYIDTKGRPFISALYSEIRPFSDGLAVFTGFDLRAVDSDDEAKKRYGLGVMDTLGNIVIPCGTFQSIWDFKNGYAVVGLIEDTPDGGRNDKLTAIIDRKGNSVLTKDRKRDQCYFVEEVSCGVAKLRYYKEHYTKFSYMTLKGDIIFSGISFPTIENFSDNRVFVRSKDRRYCLINTQGKEINETSYQDVIKPGFKNGKAFVRVDEKWALIDTNANYLIPPKYSGIDPVGILDDYFFYSEYVVKEGKGMGLYGVGGIDGKTRIAPMMSSFDHSGFHEGLLQCTVDGKMTYLDRNGKIIWQQSENKTRSLPALNIDCQRVGYYTVNSAPASYQERDSLGSPNYPKDIKDKSIFPSGMISVRVRTDVKDTFAREFQGYAVYVANRTSEKQIFNTSQSRWNVVVQALDKKGEWKNIECAPSEQCGSSSYSILTLEPDKYWQFTIPVYEGAYKTSLRIALTYGKQGKAIYSNTFTGSVNAGQFWRQGPDAGRLIDPSDIQE